VGVTHEDVLGLFRQRGHSSDSGKPDIAGNEPGDVLMLKEDEGSEALRYGSLKDWDSWLKTGSTRGTFRLLRRHQPNLHATIIDP
jgi:hypothetical protein